MDNTLDFEGKKDLAIYLFANKKFLFALGTFILNLKDKFPKYDYIIIRHQDFSEEDMENIRKIEDKVIFEKYDRNDFCKEFNFSEEQIANIHAIQRFTVLGITRFNFIKYLRKFRTVILFECDMLLTNDISELLTRDYNIAWKTDGGTIASKINYTGVSPEIVQKLPVYDIYKKAITPNAGFIVINDNFDYEKAYSTAFEYVKKYFLIHPFLIGEYTFGYIKHVLNLNLHEVDPQIFNVTPENVTLHTKLIHFFAEYKPWSKEYIQYAFRQWIDYYFKYVEITRCPSDLVTIFENIGQRYIKLAYTKERWLRVFNSGFTYPRDLILQPTLNRAVLSFKYNNRIGYDIDTPIFLDELYTCRMWIFDDNSPEITSLRAAIAQIVKTNEDIIFLEYKQSFGCRTRMVGRGKLQNAFNKLYEVTSEIRKISDEALKK